MQGHDIIVIGASAGGVEALLNLVRQLPADLPAAVFIVLHIPAHTPSLLDGILDRAGRLPVVAASDGAAIEPAHIYVAPSDHHLILQPGHMSVVRGPRENRHRPAIDPLFRSAAIHYGPRVTGLILTGSLDDGTAGMLAIKRRGGVVVIQDPSDALYPSMPQSVRQHVGADYCLPLADIGPVLVSLAGKPAAKGVLDMPDESAREVGLAAFEPALINSDDHPGEPSAFSCPECGGVLWEMQDGDLLRFRCRVGHAFSLESVMAEQADAVEEALWAALKTLEETVSLSRRLADRARERNQPWVAERFDHKEHEAEQRAAVIQRVLKHGEVAPPGEVAPTAIGAEKR